MSKEIFVINCEDDLSFNLVVRKHFENVLYNSVIEVKNGQEVIVEKKGELYENLSEGCHVVNEVEYNIFGSPKNVDRNQKTPMDIYFINKAINMRIKWGTPQTFNVYDYELKIPVEIGACGELQIKVSNARMLISKVIGVKEKYNVNDFKDFFRSKISTCIKDVIANTMFEEKVGFYNISSIMLQLSSNMKDVLSRKLDGFGIHLSDFTVENILLDEKMKEAIAEAYTKKAVLKIYETSYIEEKEFELKSKAIENNMDFPNGGYSFCPSCGTKLQKGTTFCASCREKLNLVCSECHSNLTKHAVFCPYCGKKVGK